MVKTPGNARGGPRPSPEVYFHAAHLPAPARVFLLGYQDGRAAFLGDRTLRDPEGLGQAPLKIGNTGLHYTFDPIASLFLRFELEPGESAAAVLIDGYAPTAEAGSRLLSRILVRTPARSVIRNTNAGAAANPRARHGGNAPARAGKRLQFLGEREQLRLTEKNAAPLGASHGHDLGYGTLVTNDRCCR